MMKKYYILFWLAGLLFGCSKEADEVTSAQQLSFVESSLPVQELSIDGGMLPLEIDWAHTQWNLSAGPVVEGAAFIEQITPPTAGVKERGATRTKVSVKYKKNESFVRNRQKLVLRALDGDITHEIELSQGARPVEYINVNIQPNTTFQKVTGFGGGNMMWGTDFLTANEIKSAFGTGENELGLSIYRVRLSPVRSEWPWVEATLREAQKYGATILASPWSPPASMKSNNDLVRGHLLESNYEAFALYLNDFVQHMAAKGITIHAVSIQNEPDYPASYESCDWTIDQVYNFVKNYGHLVTNTKLVAAESLNFNQAYTDKILNDPAAAANLDIVGGHLYGSGGLKPYPLAEQKGKEIWMTEYLMNLNSGVDINNWKKDDPLIIWNETMNMLGTIHDAMAFNWNAYIWWYIRRFYSFLGDGEQGTTRGAILKRGHAMSHYSKHVRPGYFRVAVQATNLPVGLKMTTYKGDNKIVAVILNTGDKPVEGIRLAIPSVITAGVSYTTSITANNAPKTLVPDDKTVTVNMEARSITTVVINY